MQCSPNIITANFSGGRNKAKTAWRHQWDHGQILCVTGIDDLPLTFTAHFSVHKEYGAAQAVEGIDGQVEIPDIWLTFGKTVYCWIYLTDGESGETVYTITIPVIPRPMPEYYEMEDTGVFDAVVAQVGGYAETADSAATRAAASAEAAATSASEAAASADAAAASASAAAQSRADAGLAATAASNAAQDARRSANAAAEDAGEAAQSARAALTYRDTAETSATEAGDAKADAVAAAQSASNAATAAGNAAYGAGQAASAAGQHATSAGQSADRAETAASTAEGKASEAAFAASQAVEAETEAISAKNTAQGAASTAQTAASTATTKAAEAAQSASNAAQSKTDAEAAATRAEQAAATLTVDDALSDTSENPVQNKVITGEVTQLKNAIDHVAESVFCISAGPGDGYVPFCVSTGDSITVKTASGESFSGTTNVRFYDASKGAIASLSVAPSHGKERTLSVTLSTPASYVKLIPNTGYAGEELIIINNSNKTYQTIKDQDTKAEKAISYALYGTVDKSADFTTGGYIPLNGGVGSTVNISTPTSSVQRAYVVIPCHAGDSFVLTATGGSGPRAWGFTDVNAVLLSVAASGANATNLTLTATEDGYFISNHDITKAYALTATQLFRAVSETTVRDIVDDAVNVPPIVVDASGDGDYTSFTLACKENYNNDRDIVVKPGTYDIVSEYVAIWGQSAVDSMADADGAIFDGWQYGVKMHGRKFLFEPGAKLVCDWTGHTVDGTHRFSALRVEMDVDIEGLDLECTATFYCIHDDYGVQTRPYTVKYKRCRVIGHSLSNADCIGGGCKKWSRHIIEDCYFDNNLTNSATVRYHNTNQADAVPEIYVSNTYFNNWFTPRYYGTQTTKMRVYVNNCEARSIHVLQESSSYTVENVELYKWCCTETNPVT